MTETGPLVTLSWVRGDLAGLPENERARLRAKQGLAMPLIELRLIGDDGTDRGRQGDGRGPGPRAVGRAKDLVKSGGEWISSVDLDGAIMGHPKVLEAAVIGLAHSKWQERPRQVLEERAPREVRGL